MNLEDKKTNVSGEPGEEDAVKELPAESEAQEAKTEQETALPENEEEELFVLQQTEAEDAENEEFSAEQASDGDGPQSTQEKESADKKKMSRGKKIALIVGCAVLAVLLLISIVGTILFFHYYGKLNYQGRDDTDVTADIRVLKLEDVNSREEYEFSVDVTKLSEEDANLILSWHSKNWTLILDVGKDPADMTEEEQEALLGRVLAAIRKETDVPSLKNELELTVIDAKTGAEKVITVKLSLVETAEDVADLAEYQESEAQKALWYYDGDPEELDDEALTQLYAKLAQAVRDLERTAATVQLKDANTNATLLMAIYRDEIADEALADVLKWKDAVLVSSVSADPTLLSTEQRSALIEEIVAFIRDMKVQRYTLKLRDIKTGTLYEFVIKQGDLEEGQLKPISAQIQKGTLEIEIDSDPNLMDDVAKKELILRIVERILAGSTVNTRELVIRNIGDGTRYILVVSSDQVSAEQWIKLLKPTQDAVFSFPIEKDPSEMSEDELEEVIKTVISIIDDTGVFATHTIQLRDGEELFSFTVDENEVTEEQLLMILRQIHRGELSVELNDTDPETLKGEERAALILRILEAIEKIENPKASYSLTLRDRKTGKQYLFEIFEDEMTEEQLGLLLSLGDGAVVTLNVATDPATMTEAQRAALIAAMFEEIEHPTRTLLLADTATGKNYFLYFRDKEVTIEQLSYLLKQIDTGLALKIKVEKDPSAMTDAEKTAFIAKVVETIKTPVSKEYVIQLRDKETGLAHVLIFTKEEVNDASIFGYLLVQSQRGTVLNCAVAKDPATMTADERKALFAAIAELVKNPPKEEDDPEALEKLKDHLENMAQNPIKHTDDIYNVLLVGTDERKVEDPTKAKNADTMILATINYKDGTITLTSLMRDTGVTYTYVSGGAERTITSKLNSAHAVGGISTLISAIETNYGVKIDNYVKVNWFSFVDVFKVLGGIEVTVNAKHLEKINLTIQDTCWNLGVDYESRALTDGGYQHLDPYQTLAYVRYRVDDADFGRTARQREVLTILFEKFKRSSLGKINEILNTVLPLLTTDLTAGNCASLLLDFPSIIGYKMQQVRLPEWQEYTSYKGMLMPDWQKTLRRLYKNAYGSLCPEQYK